METFKLEKLIWDDRDFETMSWDEATIWAVHADPYAEEFSLDLDYIFEWVNPKPGETYYKFWVAPVTMVFENVRTFKIEINSRFGNVAIEDLIRGEPEPAPNGKFVERRYQFELPSSKDFNAGEVVLRSTGFRMFVRRPPTLCNDSHLRPAERGGVGFQRDYSAA